MKVKDLDGNSQEWHLTGNSAKSKALNKSSLHLQARQLIKEMYPTLQVVEEVYIPLRKSEYLYLDFYLPLIKVCFEVHGIQHYEFTPFYHASRLSFAHAKKRDRDKQEWCEINNIRYVALPYNTLDSWKEIIRDAQNS